MLFLVLLLVLAALGLLVAALITSKSLFAWISISLSVAAALVLLFDWLTRSARARRGADDTGRDDPEPDDVEDVGADKPADADKKGERAEDDAAGERAEKAGKPEQPDAGEAGEAEDDAGPGEEQTDTADLLIVCDLDHPVVVVDEYPRYHLSACRWLMNRDTIPIAVSEARELGFTPCARCGPDAKLAAQARKKRLAEPD